MLRRRYAEAKIATDGIIFELWQEGAAGPDGKVTFPTAVSHVLRSKKQRLFVVRP